jgi:hypothetical protein
MARHAQCRVWLLNLIPEMILQHKLEAREYVVGPLTSWALVMALDCRYNKRLFDQTAAQAEAYISQNSATREMKNDLMRFYNGLMHKCRSWEDVIT